MFFGHGADIVPKSPIVLPNREKTPHGPMLSFATVFCTAARNRPAVPAYVMPRTDAARASLGWYVSSRTGFASSRSAIVLLLLLLAAFGVQKTNRIVTSSVVLRRETVTWCGRRRVKESGRFKSSSSIEVCVHSLEVDLAPVNSQCTAQLASFCPERFSRWLGG